jgi:hypothetical protein
VTLRMPSTRRSRAGRSTVGPRSPAAYGASVGRGRSRGGRGRATTGCAEDLGGIRRRPEVVRRRGSGALGDLDDVHEEHGAGHRADAAGGRAHLAGDRVDLGVDVAEDALDRAGHADGQDGRARADPVRLDQMGDTGGSDDDVRGAGVGGDVDGRLVAEGDGRVLGGTGEHEAERAADGEAAADDAEALAGDLDVVLAEQLDDAARRARQRAGDAEHELAEVGRVQPVGVLVGVDQLQHAVGVDVRRQRQLHDEAGAGVVLVERDHRRLDLLLRRGGRELHPERGDADLGAVAVLARDVRVAARVVPDQDRAETGADALRLERGDAAGELLLDAEPTLRPSILCSGRHQRAFPEGGSWSMRNAQRCASCATVCWRDAGHVKRS